MNQARSRSDGGDEENSSRDQNHHENERRWQQERLRREEAYYQFMNDLSDEDYRLMRDHDLLGTPDSGVPREGSNEDPLLEWLNTFRRMGNATRSGQNGNQTWRAVSRTNPHSGDFRFSLEIHINHENRGLEMDGEDAPGLPLSAVGRDPRADRDGQRRASSPVARRTRSHAAGAGAGGGATPPRTRRGSRGRNPVEGPLAASGRPRTGTGGPSGGAPRAGFAGPPAGGAPRPREGQRFGAAHVWELGARSNVTVRNTNQRLEPIRLRSAGTSRSRSPIHRQSGPVRPTPQSERRPLEQSVGRSVRRRGVTRVFLQQDRDRRGTAYTWFSNSRLMSRITLEEEEPSRSPPAAARRPPTITLDLQVRRLRPGEGRDRDSIAHRTRSRAGLAENAVTLESGGGGFRRTISRLERSGMRTYVSTITVPLRRLAGTQRLEPSSALLRSILRQIMTGLGELSSLMEAEAEAEAEAEGPGDARHLPPTPSGARRPGAGRAGSQRRAAASSPGRRARSREGRAARPGPHSSTLVETGMLPILRLAHFFLLNEGDGAERIRGLTKEQIDNLSTRHYEHSGRDSDLARICSVCISDYVTGNKLRQLPCMHEFHIHCIDRWLSENCTCPICRQPVLGSSTADDG
ncbi:E3 ubiquitin-protein ligase RNF6 isoform X2 [Phacochoerus africanus]|uniref:E3 ubiquitin-protein ligase RNF6 isoform X2 n=1 Tax=Phacochoerus africanus TaxID=41426 RepID=UPI001FD9CC4C|nr:E3 ubiquitin-protein ligase RNF6 isoform X2 [Phacochoerus africanus]